MTLRPPNPIKFPILLGPYSGNSLSPLQRIACRLTSQKHQSGTLSFEKKKVAQSHPTEKLKLIITSYNNRYYLLSVSRTRHCAGLIISVFYTNLTMVGLSFPI